MTSQSEYERMEDLVETISHYAESYHGGKVSLASFDGANVQVHFSGHCEECPLLPWTLKMTVERTVHDLFPAVMSVTAI